MLIYVTIQYDRIGNPIHVDHTEEIEQSNGQINIDYAKDGSIIGVEFLDGKHITVESDVDDSAPLS